MLASVQCPLRRLQWGNAHTRPWQCMVSKFLSPIAGPATETEKQAITLLQVSSCSISNFISRPPKARKPGTGAFIPSQDWPHLRRTRATHLCARASQGPGGVLMIVCLQIASSAISRNIRGNADDCPRRYSKIQCNEDRRRGRKEDRQETSMTGKVKGRLKAG